MSGGPSLTLTLDAVIVAVTDGSPRILTVASPRGPAVPSGPLDPAGDVTLERGLRRYVTEQAGIEVGYVEQLYTFGDRDRRRGPGTGRELSVAYLALVQEARPSPGASWSDWYGFFPWEDHRAGRPASLDDHLLPALRRWAQGDPARLERIAVTFGVPPTPWDGIRVLERYELLYEAGLIAEAGVDEGRDVPELPTGTAMAFDHRRIAATAMGRLRGKLTYRPVVFELLPETFTLSGLQQTVEALAGVELHTQNFRRLVDRAGLVEGTGRRTSTGGRPAELFRFRREVQLERPRPGVGLPYR
jgi:hypothetical protein